jgi:hypothetical protein
MTAVEGRFLEITQNKKREVVTVLVQLSGSLSIRIFQREFPASVC